MSFSFGTTTTQPALGFGSTPAKTGFGTGFSFGTPTSTAPGFNFAGSTSTPGFGMGALGAQPTTSAPPAFGATTQAASSTPSLFSGFGTASQPATSTTATAPAFGGFTGFGATTTSAPATGFAGFGGTNTAAGGTGFGGFGTTTTQSGFGGFGGFGAKPATATTGFTGFGSTLGAPTLGSTLGAPSFGGSTLGSSLGAPTLGLGTFQPQQQPQQVDPTQAIYNSVFNCTVFGDERDAVLAKWNLVQASWGAGKGYHSASAPPVEYTPQNPYCRFKAIGYSVIPGHDNKEGLVAVVINKKEADVKAQKDQLIQSLTAVMGNKPSLTVSIHSVRAVSETKSQALIYVQEKGSTGSVRKIPATDLSNYLLQPMQKQQLVNLGVENVFAHVKPDSDQLKEYLAKPPTGVDIRIWKQAQLDNPNPSKYIPVPLIGFDQLKWRSKCQEKETSLHRGFLEQVSKDIIDLRRRHASSVAQIAEQKRKLLELQHRVLRILVRQEVTRKAGMALQPEEEVLKGQLENMQTQISVPTQFKGRLNELLAQIRILNQNGQVSTSERYTMDGSVQEDIKQFLRMEQDGIAHLVEIINTDLQHLKIIRDGMQELLQRQ